MNDKRFITPAHSLLLFLFVVVWSAQSDGQYISREYYPLWQNESYENYAHFSFRDVRLLRQGQVLRLDEDQRTYDPFGATLLKGLDLYRTNEYRTLSPFGGSTIFKDNLYRDLFQNLVVANDTYRGWGTAFTVGRAVEAYYNPMMLGVLRMNGIRWDADSRRNRFSVLATRVSEPLRLFALSRPLDFVTYLYGGHWETQLGSILRFGASYVNTHMTDSLVKRGEGSFRKGVFPGNLISPQSIYIAVTDDSPEDGVGGGRVHAIEMYVNGELSQTLPEIRKVSDALRVGQNARFVSERMRVEDLPHARQRQSWLPRVMNFPSIALLNGSLFDVGEVLDGEMGPLEANGFDVLLYRFEVPQEVLGEDGMAASLDDISFRILVANDYAIDIGTPISWHGIQGRTWDDWRNVTRANGNPRDESNLRWVDFGHGFPTGLEMWGAQADLTWIGFEVHGDYSISNHHLLFPVSGNAGARNTLDAQAYSIVGKRAFENFDLNFEVFKVPPDYRTSFSYWDDGKALRLKEFQLIDDNDDLDPWPDSWEHEDPLSLIFQDDITLSTPESRENLEPASLRDIGFGVFPGLDDNGDGIIDTNVNDNLLPDYVEPFLMYYVESEEFVYGDDFNNNGVVDSRENDNKPDYPYERDSEGQHFFITFRPRPNLKLTFGGHDVDQLAGSGQNQAFYTKVEYNRRLGWDVYLDLHHRTKRVKDDIPDPLYEYVSNPIVRGNYEIKLRHDPLNYLNSWASLSFAKFSYKGIDYMNLNSTWRYENNRRLRKTTDDGIIQNQGTDWSLAVVNRIDYGWEPIARLVVTPMLKLSYRREDSSIFQGTIEDAMTFAPIMRVDYTLTENTILRGGIQGLPFLRHRYRNNSASFQDFDAWHYILAFQNNSSYIGYQVSMNLGLRKSFIDNVGSATVGEVETSEFFLQVRTN